MKAIRTLVEQDLKLEEGALKGQRTLFEALVDQVSGDCPPLQEVRAMQPSDTRL
jgi:hypothetical protein